MLDVDWAKVMYGLGIDKVIMGLGFLGLKETKGTNYKGIRLVEIFHKDHICNKLKLKGAENAISPKYS